MKTIKSRVMYLVYVKRRSEENIEAINLIMENDYV